VRTTDLEPYVTLRYIAKLFKVLAVLIVLMMIGEVITGLLIDGRSAVMTLLGESTRLLVLAGLLWAGGDFALLLIDAGHDIRVARILLGRINAEVHRTGGLGTDAGGEKAEPPRAASR
jgi:glucose uptake protein GlcU